MEYLPYPMLHKKWQWYLLEMVREGIDTEEVERLVDSCYRSYPKGFKRIRYYGVQTTKTFEQIREIVQEALSKVKRVVKGTIKILAQKRYRERYRESTGKDPFVCPQCGQEMDICTIWHPRYGVIYDEFAEIKKR